MLHGRVRHGRVRRHGVADGGVVRERGQPQRGHRGQRARALALLQLGTMVSYPEYVTLGSVAFCLVFTEDLFLVPVV